MSYKSQAILDLANLVDEQASTIEDLLAACKEFLAACDEYDLLPDGREVLRAAITKAEGSAS